MSQRNSKKKSKSLMPQPPTQLRQLHDSDLECTISAVRHNSKKKSKSLMPQPPTQLRQLHDSDLECTMSASPTSNAADLEGGSPTLNMTTTPPTHNLDPNDDRIFIRPIGMKALEPYDGHRKITESITRYFPEAVKTFKGAPQSMKDIWFNEYKKLCKWNPEDEAVIRKIYESIAARRLSDTLCQVRANLEKGKSRPKWMSNLVLAQYQSLWDKEEFKKLSKKNKENRNSDCGGMGPSLHTGGSIPITEHRRRLRKKLGEEPSHAVLFQATHKRKKTDEFVCKRAQQVMETVSQIQQNQPELDQATAWYEAAGGLKKGGYVFGFGSDTQHYFPEVAKQNSRHGESSSNVAYDKKIEHLEQTNKEILEQNKKIMELLQGIYCAHPELLPSIAPTANSNQSSVVGLDNLNVSDDTQSSS
nr:putative transposase En/Spm [Ipomoea batatas]